MGELSLFERLGNVETQLKKLVEQHSQLRLQRDELVAKNSLLNKEILDLKGQVANFQNQDKITKIVTNTTVEKEESTALKHKLNEYIREIDKCIAHLSE